MFKTPGLPEHRPAELQRGYVPTIALAARGPTRLHPLRVCSPCRRWLSARCRISGDRAPSSEHFSPTVNI